MDRFVKEYSFMDRIRLQTRADLEVQTLSQKQWGHYFN